jgi:signal peptidase
VLAIVIVALKLLGYSFFTVRTGSMADVYPVGAIIIVKPVVFEQVQLGDVISYHIDQDTVVTHRVIGIDVDTQSFTTQGDENNAPDSLPVEFSNVIGVPVVSFNRLGYVYLFADTTVGKWAIGGLLVSAFALSIYPTKKDIPLGEDEEHEG